MLRAGAMTRSESVVAVAVFVEIHGRGDDDVFARKSLAAARGTAPFLVASTALSFILVTDGRTQSCEFRRRMLKVEEEGKRMC